MGHRRVRAGCAPAFVSGAATSDAKHFRQEAAPADRLAKEQFGLLTQDRLRRLSGDYLKQAIELESGGQTVPPDTDPTE
jgi:hypothetical protein